MSLTWTEETPADQDAEDSRGGVLDLLPPAQHSSPGELGPSYPLLTLTPFLIRAILAASIGGILFGYDMGVVSGALPQLTDEFLLSPSHQEMIVSFLYLGCCIGAAIGGAFCDAAGRKRTICITDLVFLLGAVVLSYANSLGQLLLGRVIVGIAVSVSGIADVAYLHEISPPQWRGAIVSVNEACILHHLTG